MTPKLFYYWCVGVTGHYLWADERTKISNLSAWRTYGVTEVTHELLVALDGAFVPASSFQGVYRESVVPPLRIVSWRDNSVDKRPNSHSTLIGCGYSSATTVLSDAVKQFPGVMKRQEFPLIPEKLKVNP